MTEKTGVFLCTCDKKLNLNFKEIAREIKHKVKFAEIVDRLCTPEGQGYIAQRLRWKDERRPEKLVIAACKTKTFDELLRKYEFDRKNMIIENIREHCAWVHKEKNEATEKAKAIVKCGVVKAKYLKKPEPIKVTIDRSVALVGSPGFAIAPILEKFGATLHVIQSEGYLKRGAAKFNFYPASEVLGISGRLGNFEVTLKRKKYIDMQKCISCDACIAACPKKAIYSPEDALLHSYVISEKCDNCGACIKVCQVDAISLEEKTEEIKVGQVLYSSENLEDTCAALLRAASNLTDRERESLIRADLKKCANAGLKERKLNITGCSYCNAACAYGAISYGDVDELSCVGCGICTNACPQGVPQLRSLPEVEMFSLIEAALDTELSPKILLFSCTEQDVILQAAGVRKIDYPAATTLLVPCIGMVSDVHILRTFDLGCDGVLLLGCKKCMHGNAAKTAAFCRQLIGALGAEKERIKIIEGDADAPQKFAYAVNNFVRSLNSMPMLRLGKKKSAELDELLKEETPKRKMLLRIVQSLSQKLGIKFKEIEGNYPFGDVVVDYNKCTLCGACASLCSTEALTSTPEDLPTITFRHAYCVACGICEKICPEKALKVEKILNLERFVNVTPEEFKVELVKCKKCGRTIMAAAAYRKLSSMLQERELEFLGLCKNCKGIENISSSFSV